MRARQTQLIQSMFDVIRRGGERLRSLESQSRLSGEA